jgi:hypothetical protein
MTDLDPTATVWPLRYPTRDSGDHVVRPRVWLAETAIAINEPAPAQPFDCVGSFKAVTVAAWARQICSFRNGRPGVQVTAIQAREVVN